MKKSEERLALVLRLVLDQQAQEIELLFTSHDMAVLTAGDDSTFTTFRLGLQELRARKVEPTKRILHVEKRMTKAYQKWFKEPLPPLDDEVFGGLL